MAQNRWQAEHPLKSKLDILKHYPQKETSLRELAHSLLQQDVDEMVEAARDFPANIFVVAQKIDKQLPLNAAEWQYLTLYVHKAYKMQHRKRTVVSKIYLEAMLEAFSALLAQTQDTVQENMTYFSSNLSFLNYQEKPVTSIDEINAAIEETKAELSDGAYLAVGERISRNLYHLVLMVTGSAGGQVEVVNEYLAPYLKSLLILAKKNYYDLADEPAFHGVDIKLFNHQTFRYAPELHGDDSTLAQHVFENDDFSLQAQYEFAFNTLLVFKNGGGEPMVHLALKFPQVNELIHLMETIHLTAGNRKIAGEFFALEQVECSEHITLNYGTIRFYLNPTRCAALKAVLKKLSDDNIDSFHALRQQWGDI